MRNPQVRWASARSIHDGSPTDTQADTKSRNPRQGAAKSGIATVFLFYFYLRYHLFFFLSSSGNKKNQQILLFIYYTSGTTATVLTDVQNQSSKISLSKEERLVFLQRLGARRTCQVCDSHASSPVRLFLRLPTFPSILLAQGEEARSLFC